MVLGSAPHFWKSGVLFKCLILVTRVWECGSSSPQLWSFLDHNRFCHLRGGSSQEPAWPSPFPILLFKMFEKGTCALLFAYLLFSWNGRRKQLNWNLGLNSLTPDSHGYRCFEPSPSRTRIFFKLSSGAHLLLPPSVPCGFILIPCSLVAPSWSLSSSSLSHKSNNPACFDLLSASAVRVKPTLPRDSRLSTTPELSGLWLAVLPRGQSKALF